MEKVKCPKCKSENIAKIIYGLFDLDEKLQKKIENGEVVLGGCEMFFDNPIYRCNHCYKEF
ncbi:MAG: hypothetical protein MUC29_08640 [Pyrinomonadaceae bacterium]|jgi:hypothetical protein|nr:hypothetical protein [Pyrinomonadaceae bacterium]